MNKKTNQTPIPWLNYCNELSNELAYLNHDKSFWYNRKDGSIEYVQIPELNLIPFTDIEEGIQYLQTNSPSVILIGAYPDSIPTNLISRIRSPEFNNGKYQYTRIIVLHTPVIPNSHEPSLTQEDLESLTKSGAATNKINLDMPLSMMRKDILNEFPKEEQ